MNASAKRITVLDILGNGGLVSKKLPGYQERPQQIKTAQLIETGIANRRHVVVELGTGGGKSLAGLFPAVASGERVTYSTEVKSLQEQIEQKDAPFVAELMEQALGRPVRVAVLKGRGNYVCLRNVDRLEQGEFRSQQAVEAFGPLAEWIGQQRTSLDVADIEKYPGELPTELKLDVVTSTEECTGQRCKFYKTCFAERAKSRAKNANIVVVNHKLLCVDAMVREKTDGQAGMIPDYSLLIADEAHGWEDIIRDTAGFEITPGRLTRLARNVQKLTIGHPVVEAAQEQIDRAKLKNEVIVRDEVTRATRWAERQEAILGRIDQYLRQVKARIEQQDDAREIRLGDERDVLVGEAETLFTDVEDARPNILMVANDLVRYAWEMQGGTPSWLADDDRDLWIKLAEQTETLARELITVLSPDSDATWVRRASLDGEEGRTRVVLDAKPIDVAPIARRWFFNTSKQRTPKQDADGDDGYVESMPPLTVISMSATIATNSTMKMYRERLGVDDALEYVAGSTFDYKRNALLFLPTVPAELVPVQRNKPEYPAYLANLSRNMLGLTLDAKGGAFLLFTSRSAMNDVYATIAPDLERAGLLVMKQGDASRNQMIADFKANGNAVLFGLKTFGVGIDVQGSALRLVAIDKVPFNPPTDVVWNALCQDVKRRGGNDFRDLALPNAIITLKQFAGRLIRSHTDMGVMALLDGRVRTQRYGQEIVANMPGATITSDPRMVRDLYARMGYDSAVPASRPVVRDGFAVGVALGLVEPITPVETPTRRFRRLSDGPPRRFRRLSRV